MKKKGLKLFGVLAGAAALAALLPNSIRRDEDSDTTTIRAMLWKYTNRPDHETPGNRKVSIDIGFHNPMDEDVDFFLDDEDDLLLSHDPDCDIELTLKPDLTREQPAPEEESKS